MILATRIFEILTEVGIIDQLAGTLLDNALPRGVTRAQFGVLNHFARLQLGEQSPGDLARAFQVRRPTMTSTLTRMERAGLVTIRTNPADGRSKLASATAAGLAMREHCIEALDRLRLSEMPGVDEAQLAAALPALRSLRMALDAARS